MVKFGEFIPLPIGKVTAEYLSERGAAVVLGARSTDKIEALSSSIDENGSKALAVTIDVMNKDQVKNLVDSAVDEFGQVEVMLKTPALCPSHCSKN